VATGVRNEAAAATVTHIHLAGALNDHEGDDGAVGNRDAHYIGGFAATWPPGVPADPHVAWARNGWQRTRPFSTGGNYVNFQLADDDTARTAAAYGTNYQRLQQAKATHDPNNLFRINRNIPQRPDDSPTCGRMAPFAAPAVPGTRW
jgi:hypothetical protein